MSRTFSEGTDHDPLVSAAGQIAVEVRCQTLVVDGTPRPMALPLARSLMLEIHHRFVCVMSWKRADRRRECVEWMASLVRGSGVVGLSTPFLLVAEVVQAPRAGQSKGVDVYYTRSSTNKLRRIGRRCLRIQMHVPRLPESRRPHLPLRHLSFLLPFPPSMPLLYTTRQI